MRLQHRFVLGIAGVAIVTFTNVTGAGAQPQVSPPTVGRSVQAVRVAPAHQSLAGDPSSSRQRVVEGEKSAAVPPGIARPIADPVIQLNGASPGREAIGLISAPNPNFAGMTSAPPPDTVLDVGPNHVIQMVNSTFFQVWNKQGVSLGGPFSFGAMWPAGDACNSSLGDPIVVYDHLADRWLLSQFARNAAQTQFWMCIAISQTPNPLPASGYFLYTIEVNDFPDYPKFGVWPDAYYMSSYESPNLGIFAFERQQMLNGNAAAFVKFTISDLVGVNRDTRILPADLDGPPPPDGTPGFFFRSVDDLQDNADPRDRLEVWEFDVDWLIPANSTFTMADDIDGTDTPALAPFNTMACNRAGGGIRDCIPEPDSDDTIDALSNRPMMQLKFRVLAAGDFRMVTKQTIDVSGSIPAMLGITPANEVAGMRWYELQKTGSNWNIRQQGTYAPQPLNADAEGDLLHRWMGSAAIDRFGNLAIGYSIVNDADDDGTIAGGGEVYPGIRYTGRRFDDPLGTMQQGELVILNGAGPQGNRDGTVNPSRWGDYSALTVDPVDDCTFWYSTHGVAGITRIAAFRFDLCGADLRITKSDSPDPVLAGRQLTYAIEVANDGPSAATNVIVRDTLPSGVAYLSSTVPCAQGPGGVLTCNLGPLAAGASRAFSITVLVDPNVTAVAGGSTTITNTAQVSSDQADTDPSDNTATAITTVQESADLQLVKECKPDQPNKAPAGTTTFCEIYIDNLGPSDARNVVVTDRVISSMPVTITAVTLSSTHPPAGTCSPSAPIGPGTGATITCTDTVLPAGGRNVVRVEFTAQDGGDVNDTASVSGATPDPQTSNNVGVGRVSFGSVSDLRLTKSDSPDPVIAGTNVTYTMNVTNLGPSSAQNVVIKDVLSGLVAFVSASPSQGSCQAGVVPGDPDKPLTCNLGLLASQGGASLTVVVRVNSDVPEGTILVNNASVAGDSADPNNANDVATAETTVHARADVGIVKTSDATHYKPSSVVTYRIDVVNNGPSRARDVVVTDNLPDMRHAVYQSDTGGCVLSTPTTLTCGVGDLEVGQARTFFIYVLVKGSQGVVTNAASVATSTVDPVPGNDNSVRVVTVKGGS